MGNPFSAPGNFPTTGKAITVRLQCSHSNECIVLDKHRGCYVTCDWTAAHLREAIEWKTGVARQCQRLLFSGRFMDDNCTILSCMEVKLEQLPARVSLYLLVETDLFPQKLGPFKPVRVPFKAEDFSLPVLTDLQRNSGFYWHMATGVLEAHGLRARSARITGQVSPAHPVLEENAAQRKAIGIPPEAHEFAFSYPVCDWERVEHDVYSANNWEMLEDAAAMQSFLSVGGYFYFNTDGIIVAVTTMGRLVDGESGGLHFAQPERWLPEWTASLVEHGRFQPVTMKSLVESGAKKFCWLRPKEILECDGEELPKQPEVPHGGFVYLFHQDVGASDEVTCVLDRYFAVVPRPIQSDCDLQPTANFRAISLIGGDLAASTMAEPPLGKFESFLGNSPVQEETIGEEGEDETFMMTHCSPSRSNHPEVADEMLGRVLSSSLVDKSTESSC